MLFMVTQEIDKVIDWKTTPSEATDPTLLAFDFPLILILHTNIFMTKPTYLCNII